MLLEYKLKIINFFKKHWKKILLILAVWAVVLVINYFVGKMDEWNFEIDTNYKPHEAIMDNDEVPEKLRDPIAELIADFVENCNSKNYETAYNMLSEECRNAIYPNIELFKTYVDYVFDGDKIHNIQNFSNKNNTYIYNVTILEDILATGFNNEEEMLYYQEKFVITENNGQLKLAIRNYIGSQNLAYMYEDDNMKIKVESIEQNYDNVIYNFSIANKTDKVIVYADYTENYEIALDTSEGSKRCINDVLKPVILLPGETLNYSMKYIIYFDEPTEIYGLMFNNIRIFNNIEAYENAVKPEKDFSIKINF